MATAKLKRKPHSKIESIKLLMSLLIRKLWFHSSFVSLDGTHGAASPLHRSPPAPHLVLSSILWLVYGQF